MKIVLDIETNSTHDNIWCVVTRNIDTDEVIVWKEANNLQRYLDNCDLIIMHNGINFDAPVLRKTWKVTMRLSQVYDTLVASRLLNPSLEGGHSLAAWGERLGFPKGDFSDWDGGLSEEMITYCIQDTLVTKQLYLRLVIELDKQGFSQRSIELEHNVQAVITKQEENGFKLNQPLATQLLCELKTKLDSIQVEMERIFPPRITTGRTHKGHGRPLPDIIEPFNPGSRKQIGERLIEKGWKPTVFTENGQAKVDETVLAESEIPEAKAIAEFLMLQKRIAQIESWLDAVQDDGRVHGRVITSGAVTYRATHMSPNMAQVPSSKKPYGKECRSLWCVDEGNVLVGVDLSGIELRCFAHYLQDKEYINEVVNGDVHTRNQQAFGVATRDLAKTVLYASLYGASAAKVGSIIGIGASGGKKTLDNFARSVPAYKELTEKISRMAAKGKLPGLGGYQLTIRSTHSSLNTLLQSAGAIIAKQWIIEFTKNLKQNKIPYKLVGWIHDEVQIETPEQYGETVGKIVVEAAKKAGETLEFRCPVAAEYNIGKNWEETH